MSCLKGLFFPKKTVKKEQHTKYITPSDPSLKSIEARKRYDEKGARRKAKYRMLEKFWFIAEFKCII
jgi:hypothetical protein